MNVRARLVFPDILCGTCGGPVGRMDGASRLPGVVPERFWIPPGLSLDRVAVEYRWNPDARNRIARGQKPRNPKRSGRGPREYDFTWKGSTLVYPISDYRAVKVPAVVPCPLGHKNDVDAAVLAT